LGETPPARIVAGKPERMYFIVLFVSAALTGKMDMRRIAALVRGNRLRLLAVAVPPATI
jgi:hypothetical protein